VPDLELKGTNMIPGMIGYGQPGSVVSTAQVGTSQMAPSGNIWADSSPVIEDEGNGFWVNKTFAAEQTLPGLPIQNGTYTNGSGDDHSLNIAFSSTAVAAMFTRPLAPVAPGGNTKLWFEVAVAPQQTTNQTYFFGLVGSTGLGSTILASSTTLLSTASLIGFFVHGDVPTNVDAVYQKANAGLNTVLASVLTANANNPNPANVNYVPAGAAGAFDGSHYVKLGLRIDKSYVYFYVNGTQVAKKQLDSTFDLSQSYGAIVAAFTSTSATDNLRVGFFRASGKIAGQV
jgi:hypothetical protein